MCLDRAAAVLGDAKIFEAKFLRRPRHFLECVVPVARDGVTMKCAAQIFPLDQARQRMFFRRVEFAGVFAQLRRNEIEIERAIKSSFVANPRNLDGRSFLSRSGIGRSRRETIFVQRPTALQRAAAHLDVVLFAAGEVIQRKRIFSQTDDAQVALDPGAKPHTRLGRSLRDE